MWLRIGTTKQKTTGPPGAGGLTWGKHIHLIKTAPTTCKKSAPTKTDAALCAEMHKQDE